MFYYSDVNNNLLTALGSKSFQNLPRLVTLRLHTQTPDGLTSIQYDAFSNIGASLKYLWVILA